MKDEKNKKYLERLVLITTIIVLITIGVLGYYAFLKKESINNDHVIIDEMNRALILNENKDKRARYCDEAVDQCIAAGFILENLTPSTFGYNFAYDQANNRFMLLDSKYNFDYGAQTHTDVENEPWKIFVVVGNEKEMAKAVKGERNFSVYLRHDFAFENDENSIEALAGVDTGKCESVKKIIYNNDKQQDVVFRTNGGELVINDNSQSVISHYEKLTVLDVVKCHTASYHEYGDVVLANIKAGHIAFEEESSIENVHFEVSGTETVQTANGEKTYDTFDKIIVSYKEGVMQPDYSRDKVRINPEGTKVCTLSLAEETNNIFLTLNGIYEQIVIQPTTVEIENGESSTEESIWVNISAATLETKIAADQIANQYGGRKSALEDGAIVASVSGVNDKNGSRELLNNEVEIDDVGETKQEVLSRVTVNEEFTNYIKLEAINGIDIIKNKTNYGIVESQIKALYNKLDGNFNNIVYGVYYNNHDTASQDDDELYLLNGRTYTAVSETSYLQSEGKYQYWHGDFVIKFNKDIAAYTDNNHNNTIILVGEYGDWGWLKFPIENSLKANNELRLLQSYMDGSVSINYEELCTIVKTFKCGAAYFNEDYDVNDPLTITVEFRLYETEAASAANNNSTNVETGKYVVVDTYSYTFGK